MIEDRSALLLGIHWTWTTLSTLSVTGRLYGRTRDGIKLGWEDLWILPALCCSYGLSIISTLFAHVGATESTTTRPASEAQYISRLEYTFQVFALLGLATGKISVMCLIKRLQVPTTWRTVVLWVLGVILAIYNVAQIFLQELQCDWYLRLSWEQCANASEAVVVNAPAGSIWNAIVDLALVAIALHMIRHLNMPSKRKIAVSAALSTGIFPFCIAIVKIYFFFAFSAETDIAWVIVLLFIWNACEVNSIIVAACVPTLAPLYRVLRGRQSARHSSKSPSRDETRPPTISSPPRGLSRDWYSVESRTTTSLDLEANATLGTELEGSRDARAVMTGSMLERVSQDALIA